MAERAGKRGDAKAADAKAARAENKKARAADGVIEPTAAEPAAATGQTTTAAPSLLGRLIRRAWWAHSGFALVFGVGVMIYSRSGLRYADKLLVALGGSWLLMFVALRFIVGPANRREVETLARKGVRLATNYVIKQFYQQMFFFLVPLYASSATWSTASWNWWMAPILLACAVVSTLDLVFDNVIMERRWLAAAMYGLAMFGLLNVMLPLVAGSDHLAGLMVAAGATPLAVALLSFSLKQVFSAGGLLLTVAATAALVLATSAGRRAIPPAPLAMLETAVGHGSFGSYECMPASKRRIPADQLDGLRCGSFVLSPGGVREPIEHRYLHNGAEIFRTQASALSCDGDDQDRVVMRSALPSDHLPQKPEGSWQCATYTASGQLVGLRRFQVVATAPADAPPGSSPSPAAP
jgi:Family of unknown function (DUF5924)